MKGDIVEWEIDDLVREHDRALRSFVRARGGADIADDLVGDVWIAAIEAQRNGRALQPGWLYAVARNKLVDHWRRAERGAAVMTKIAASTEVVCGPAEPTTIDMALEGMPPRHRRLLEGHYVDGFSMQLLADEQGTTYRAAESALSRARQSLRLRVEELEAVA